MSTTNLSSSSHSTGSSQQTGSSKPPLRGPSIETSQTGDSVTFLAQPRDGIPSVTDTAEGFAAALDDLAGANGPLAADAERASSYRYSARDYLIQLRRQGSATYLLDIPALQHAGVRFSELTDRLADVEWILHDGAQDLPSFHDLGLRITRLFDTEYAARLLGLSRPGLSHCTEHYLGYSLAKEHAAADWSYRPLPLDWRNYAALDVELLVELRHAMVADLKKQGKLEWALEEFDAILKKGMADPLPDPEPWRHTSRITVLGADRRALAIVRSLWYERDRQAKALDISPTLLLRDSDMVEAALRKPRNKYQFAQIRCLNERVEIDTDTEQDEMFNRYIPLQQQVKPLSWEKAIRRALRLPYSQLPEPSAPQEKVGTSVPRSMKFWRLHQPQRYARLMAMRRTLSSIAQDVHVPVELLVKPRLIRHICWDEIPPEQIIAYLRDHDVRRWQIDLVGSSLVGITIQGLL